MAAAATTTAPLVFFTVEATGLRHEDPELVQINAVFGEREYNNYVMPSKEIQPVTTLVTGLRVKYGQLLQGGTPVKTVPLVEALQGFIDFIQDCEDPGRPGKPILIGHNINRYDMPILRCSLLRRSLLKELAACISGYVDTLQLARDLIPRGEVEDHKQETLVKKYLGKKYARHNSIRDVKALQTYHDARLAGYYDVEKYIQQRYILRVVY